MAFLNSVPKPTDALAAKYCPIIENIRPDMESPHSISPLLNIKAVSALTIPTSIILATTIGTNIQNLLQ